MSSPIVLKAMATGDGKYQAIALLMPHSHLNNLNLRLKNSGSSRNRNLPRDLSPNQWWDTQKAKDVIPITDNNGSDALTAFMNYFEKEGEIKNAGLPHYPRHRPCSGFYSCCSTYS